MISTTDNILFTSTSFPLVILHNKEQSQLNFALIKCLPSKEAARKGHVPADEYAQSLQPGSRHPSLPLSPKQPCLQLEVIWHITSTQVPTSLTASDDPMTQSSAMADLIIHVFYREEKQLAFIRFSPATMQVAPVFVLKDVVQVARCEAEQEGASVELSRGTAQHRHRDQYLGDLS